MQVDYLYQLSNLLRPCVASHLLKERPFRGPLLNKHPTKSLFGLDWTEGVMLSYPLLPDGIGDALEGSLRPWC